MLPSSALLPPWLPTKPPRFVLLALLRHFSWAELRFHPWRNLAAVVAVMLGVALGLATQLINNSAMLEMGQAVRVVNGAPDVTVKASIGHMDEALIDTLAKHPQVAIASPVIEVRTQLVTTSAQPGERTRTPLKVFGVDVLRASKLSPALVARPDGSTSTKAIRDAVFAPATLFFNASASIALGSTTTFSAPRTVQLQLGLNVLPAVLGGSIAAPGSPMAVMDIAAAQDFFGLQGKVSRIDLQLTPGTKVQDWLSSVALPAGVLASTEADGASRLDALSNAYRTNMGVLALVALFTGAYLVFSVMSLGVAKRSPQLALLAVMGLTASERTRLVLLEAFCLGALGSAAGIALGLALAQAALRQLGGDLGGGYFAGTSPNLHVQPLVLGAYFALGVFSTLLGAWVPARIAAQLDPAPALKGAELPQSVGSTKRRFRLGFTGLLGISVALCLVPPVFGLALGAYMGVGGLLLAGIGLLPILVEWCTARLRPQASRHVLSLLAVERAFRVRQTAAVAVSGIVASLSLAVALTVMVASFRTSVMQWLDVMVAAPLFVRSAASSSIEDSVHLTPLALSAMASAPGVSRVSGQRTRALLLDASRPSVVLQAVDWQPGNLSKALAWVEGPVSLPSLAPPGSVAIYVSESFRDFYGESLNAKLGQFLQEKSTIVQHPRHLFAMNFDKSGSEKRPEFFVAGVWRDYARQHGTIAMQLADYVRISGDTRISDASIWLLPDAELVQTRRNVETALANALPGSRGLFEFGTAAEIREISLRIFDRSFAVTVWLQGVAIGIGLFGVAASFSAQVMARRKEFGLLAHLGLTRKQVLALIAAEGLVWTAIGSLAGLVLGLIVSVVLVHVVNPQSFHWTMDMAIPFVRLAALCAAVVLAGTTTAWLAGRAAASRNAVLAVRQDW